MSTDDKKDHPENYKKPTENEFPIQEYKLVPIDYHEHASLEEDENLFDFFKKLLERRVTIYRFICAGFLIGIIIAFLSPKEYESSATLMPEYNTEGQTGASSLLQQYGGLLGIGGGTYNSSSNAIRVKLYPEIVKSLTFQKSIMQEEVYFLNLDTTTTVYEYFDNLYDPGILKSFFVGLQNLPYTIKNSIFRSNEQLNSSFINDTTIIALSQREKEIIDILRKRITASLNEENGVISVSVRMPDKLAAAEITKSTIETLTIYLTEYRTEKAYRDLNFLEDQLINSEERFRRAQTELAQYEDSNQGNRTAVADTERQRLRSEYDLTFNLYNSFTQQYEEAKLKVLEETPVFKVLQPVQVPVNNSEPRRSFILFVSLFLSLVLSIATIYFKINYFEFAQDNE